MKLDIGKVAGKFLSEDNGNLSTMRILTFLIVGTVLFNWTFYNITSGTLASFSWQDLGTVFLPLLAKAYQKGKEVEKIKP